MQLWICPILAFLLGSVPFGLIIARLKGIDIRSQGSGNIGATNVLRVVGKKYGITCLFLDALKGVLPTMLGLTLIRFVGQDLTMTLRPLLDHGLEMPAEAQWKAQTMQVVCGLCAILGHNYSPWVGFKGGKGIATSAGVLIALMPAAVVILIAIWVLLFLTTRYVSVASMGAAALLPPLTLFGSWFHGKLANGTWNKPLFAFTVVIAVLAIWKHRSNIQRLREGTENRFQPKSRT